MRDITLNPFETAVFLARMEWSENKQRKRIVYPYELKDRYEKYTDQYRIARWERENEEIDFIINFLKEYYPDKNYVNQFMEWQGNKWRQPLRFPTEESKKCKYHGRDKFHCSLKRESGCTTCCFYCFSPRLCEWSNCKLLKDNQ